MLPLVTLLLIAVPMLLETRRSRANERALRAAGAIEPPDDVYPVMQIVYPTIFVVMIVEGALRQVTWGAGTAAVGLVVFVLAKALKYAAIATLGPRWTFRVLVPPGSVPTRRGVYRWLRHPNYVGVMGEIIGIALMMSALVAGLVSSVLFAVILWRRVVVEEQALGEVGEGVTRREVQGPTSEVGGEEADGRRPPLARLEPRTSNLEPSDPTLPRWARALDVVSALLLVVLCSAVLHNGFRLTIADTRISATSVWRAVFLLLVVAGVRHAIVRRPSWLADARARAQRFWRDPATRAAWPSWWSTRLTVLVAAYFATLIIGFPRGEAPVRVSEHEWLNLPARWDAMWYLGIAKNGYEYDPATAGYQNVAFFPAYPMLMRVGGALLGAAGRPHSNESYVALSERSDSSWLWAGVVISLWSFFLAQRYLFHLGRELLPRMPPGSQGAVTRAGGDVDDAAGRALVLTATFPFALFFSAVYTESLFLLASLGALYHYRRREWIQAASWGALVGLVRPNGCFLSVPLALIGLALAKQTRADAPGRGWDLRTLALAGLVAAVPGVAMLAYTAGLYGLTGQWFAWAEAHQAWGREYLGIQESLEQFLYVLQLRDVDTFTQHSPYAFLNALPALGALACIWPIGRSLGLPYAVFVLVNLGPPLLAGGFMSTGRLVATLFPVFLYLGWRLSPAACQQWATVGLLLQGAFAAMHFTWRPLV